MAGQLQVGGDPRDRVRPERVWRAVGVVATFDKHARESERCSSRQRGGPRAPACGPVVGTCSRVPRNQAERRRGGVALVLIWARLPPTSLSIGSACGLPAGLDSPNADRSFRVFSVGCG